MEESLRASGCGPTTSSVIARRSVWRIDGIVVGQGQTLLSLRTGDGGARTLLLEDRPDRSAALRHMAGVRRVSWVRIDVDLDAAVARCEVAGTTRRPVRVQVPLGAALAFLDGDVPGMVVLSGRDA